MKRILVSMLAVVSLLLVASCSKDENGDSAELMLSEKSIAFESKAGEKTVTVTTDQDDWKAFATASEWVTLVRDGANVTIKVAENRAVKERKCDVVFMAGSANGKIEITQKGADATGAITENDIKVDQYEGNVTVDIAVNDKDWTATTDADWITLTPKQYKHELTIKYTENKERTHRTGKIVVNIGEVKKEIMIKQNGILFYLLPYLDFRGNAKEIKKFEFARKSDMIDRNPEASDWNFDTQSPYLYRVRYFMKDASGKVFEEAHTYAKNVAEFEKDLPGFIDFLEENGFKLEKGKDNFYRNEEKSVAAEITILKDRDIATVVYRYLPKQDKAYPTFKKLPNIPELPWESTNNAIKAYEAANNGDFKETQSQVDVPNQMYDFLMFSVNSNDSASPFARLYYTGHEGSKMFKKGLIIKNFLFKNTELAFYRGLTKEYFMTREFLKLAKDNGYGEPQQGTNDYIDFVNVAQNTKMQVKVNPQYNNALEIIFMRIDGIAKASAFSYELPNVK